MKLVIIEPLGVERRSFLRWQRKNWKERWKSYIMIPALRIRKR